ncbi:hypothetical protein QJS10_CPA09g01267 [Acorus calamus]|uniref:CID domain-containing protein n=1 Tax=Acorus calamus TaxID=4465 RepID=A0AAV9E6V4_ACOCL|nr:hypothetical protein QJS10_CPA09g01267 [Acorus calamus]
MRDRVLALEDSERQLHIVYLANDILFDSLQRRVNPHELDNEAHAFRPVLGSMLARIYHYPQNKEANQSRLQKILQFWLTKEVYDADTIHGFENEMTGEPSSALPKLTKEVFTGPDSSGLTGFHQTPPHALTQWQHDHQRSSAMGLHDQELPDKQHLPPVPSIPSQFMTPGTQHFLQTPQPYPPLNAAPYPIQQPPQQPAPHLAPPSAGDQPQPPYPLFPPGLIPGMVKKMQIGSGVPYSPMSPLDIPTVIPPSTVTPSEILDMVSKFFKEIGEVNPSEGPMKPSERGDGSDDDGYEYKRDSPVRKGGARIPPPPNLQADPETGMLPDGSIEERPGSSSSGRLGLGATANPNEVSQYDDVYSSYRKQRSTNYHSSMSTRAAAR